ncbi:DUF2188 domain-containing protein [Halanaerobium saccharolyticum]|uniref:DUF2188 domain-containing protein n=1 Tax=Halanaerobium saccharolyticum TaxID=43595 RepID=UPI003FCE3540
MSRKNQHIVPTSNNEWGVKGENNKKLTAKFKTQKEAINHGKEICKNQKSELLVHGKNGRIRKRNSYGNDPFPPKG